MAEITLETGKRRMKVFSTGNGKKAFVILPGLSIHSIMRYSADVGAAYSPFLEEYTLYLFDRSEDIELGYSISDMASDTALAFRSLGIESADIFSASQGGMIALEMEINHPGLCRSVVLGSTLSRVNDTFLSVASTWIEKAEKMDEEGLLGSFVDAVYSQNTLKIYRDAIIASNRGITEEEYRRFIILTSASLDFDVSDSLGRIKTPTLVIGSEGDRVVTPEASRETSSALGCGCYMYPSSYGHAVYDEAPDYRERILEFFHSAGK